MLRHAKLIVYHYVTLTYARTQLLVALRPKNSIGECVEWRGAAAERVALPSTFRTVWYKFRQRDAVPFVWISISVRRSRVRVYERMRADNTQLERSSRTTFITYGGIHARIHDTATDRFIFYLCGAYVELGLIHYQSRLKTGRGESGQNQNRNGIGSEIENGAGIKNKCRDRFKIKSATDRHQNQEYDQNCNCKRYGDRNGRWNFYLNPGQNWKDLRFNKITKLPSPKLRHLHRLRSLLLNDNLVTELQDGVFYGLRRLKYLYLYRNRIKFIESNVFQGLTHLEQLIPITGESTTELFAGASNQLRETPRVLEQGTWTLSFGRRPCVGDRARYHLSIRMTTVED
ncbi:Peroxidasin [Eumeta japonica]|uniref:Peroxidasin n=1 Tax=Eumeta variegata TaxID=151549 RepID=A0A4C1ZQW2_EUMVA|nr:Peroxidasin [Eumeta japonica]